MTNEQAIKWIKQIQKVGYQDNLLNHKEALAMAIKALEQQDKTEKLLSVGVLRDCESCKVQTPCEDAISRQAVLDLCERFNGGVPYSVLSSRDMLQSVSTEKTGLWKKIKSGDKAFPEIIVCSRCGYENSYINEWNFNNEPLSKVFKTSKYCPNCGARMVEPQESEG